eukprot:m.129013 g.129013  ORF g.129013 m.129013 type:complete len:1366 (-) comp15840_c0_seq18:35-4132(-)
MRNRYELTALFQLFASWFMSASAFYYKPSSVAQINSPIVTPYLVTILDLSSMGLTGESLNRSRMYLYNSTTTLSLVGNPIGVLPDGLLARSVPKLGVLRLQNTSLRELSDKALYQLANLTRLEVSNNPFISIHDHAFATNRLTRLHLEYCNLQTVPLAVRNETAIRHLHLRENQLAELDLKLLSSLLVLNADSNPLVAINASIFTTSRRLFGLSLQGCGLEQFPKAVHALTRLWSLNLAENEMTQLADSDLGKMPQLESLNIRANPIHSFSNKTFLNNQQLHTLEMSFLPSPILPLDTFDPLTNLKALHCSAKEFLDSIVFQDRHFEKLTQLQTLSLNRQIRSASFVASWNQTFAERHPDLSTVNIEGLALTRLPEAIIHMTKLHSLSIGLNQLATFPLLPAGNYTDLNFGRSIVRVPSGYLARVRPVGGFSWGSGKTECSYDSNAGKWTCDCGAGTSHPPGSVDACEWMCPTVAVNDERMFGPIGTSINVSCASSLSVAVECVLGNASDDYAVWQVASNQRTGVVCDVPSGTCVCSDSTTTLFNVPSRDTQPPPADFPLTLSADVIRLDQCSSYPTVSIASWVSNSSSKLKVLQLRNCSLTTAGLEQVLAADVPSVRRLDLSINSLTDLPVATMRNLGSITLEHLNISHNQITTLDGRLAHFGQIQPVNWSLSEFDVSFNRLTALTRQDSPTIGKYDLFDLRHNQIQTIDNDAIGPVISFDRFTPDARSRQIQMEGNPSRCSLVIRKTPEFQLEYQTIVCNCSSKLTNVPICPRDPTVACDTSSNAQRIPIQSVCDGVDDCGNGADEVSCSTEAIVEDTTCTIFKDLCDLQCIGDGNIDISHGVAVYRQHKECSSDNLCTPYTLLLASLGSAVGVGGVSPLSLYRTGEGRVQLNVSAQVKLGGEAVAFPCIASFKTDNLFLLLGDPASSADPKALSRKSSSLAVIAAVAGAVLLVLIVASIIYSRRRRVREGESAMRAVSVVAQQLQATGVGKTDLLLTESAVSVGDVIGTGNFGIVHKGMYEGTAVAVKAFQALQSEEEIRAVSYEALMLQELGSHEHIVKLLGIYCNAQAQICLVLELARGGDLKTYLRQPQQAPVGIKLQVLQQLTSAVAFLHSKKILHRDLAARNVLLRHINSLEAVMLADFGLSRFLSSDRDYYQHASVDNMPYRWMALEAMTNGKHSKASDVWSLGVVMWEMFHGARRPYSSCTTMVEVLQHLQQGRRLKMDNLNLPTALKSMLQQCWHEHPSQRPTLDTISNQLTALIGSRALELEHNEEPDEMVCGLSTVFWLVSLHVCRSPTFERALTDNGSFTTPTGFSFNCLFSRTQLTHCMTICITYHHAATPSTESVFMSLPLEDSVPFET